MLWLKSKKNSVEIKGKKLILNPWTYEAYEWASDFFATDKNKNGIENLQLLMESGKPIAYLNVCYYLLENKKDFKTIDDFRNFIKDESVSTFNRIILTIANVIKESQPEIHPDIIKKKVIRTLIIGIAIGSLMTSLIYWLADINIL